MKVILLSDVKGLGKQGEVKETSNGYAMNFLIPKKLAVAYTDKAKEILKKQQDDELKQAEAKIEGKTPEWYLNAVWSYEGDRVFNRSHEILIR